MHRQKEVSLLNKRTCTGSLRPGASSEFAEQTRHVWPQ